MRRLLFVVLLCASGGVSFAVHTQGETPLPYAEAGPYAVGVRDFTIAAEGGSGRDLTVSMWYPALNPDDRTDGAAYGPLLTRATGQALRDAVPNVEGGPYPLLVYSHGSGLTRYLSLFFTEHIASYGFVVIAADHPTNTIVDILRAEQFSDNIVPSYVNRPMDVLRQIAFAEALTAPDAALAGMINTDNIGVTGYSFGGTTALMTAGGRWDFTALNAWCDDNAGKALDAFPDSPFFPVQFDETSTYGSCFLRGEEENLAALLSLDSVPEGLWPALSDERVRALVTFAPWNVPLFGEAGLENVEVPTFIIGGTADHVALYERDARRLYDLLTTESKSLLTFEGADHFIFVDECPQFLIATGQEWSCTDPVWQMGQAHDIINHYTTAFLLAEFYDDAEASAFVMSDGTDLVDGLIYETTRSGE